MQSPGAHRPEAQERWGREGWALQVRMQEAGKARSAFAGSQDHARVMITF